MNAKKTMLFAVLMVAMLGVSALSGCTTSETNKKPKANAGNDISGYVNVEVTLMGSGSDPDGKIKKYEWDLNGDGKFDTVNTTSGIYTYKYTSAGVYNAVLKVTDNKGATAKDTCVVTITVKPNSAPVVTSAVPSSANITLLQGTTQGLSVTCSDSDGDLLSYQWYIDNAIQTGQTAPTFDIPTTLTVGTHTISVEINDGKASTWNNWTLTINPSSVNHAPVIASKNPAGDLTLLQGATQIYSVTATDSDADALTYTWFVDGIQASTGASSYTIPTTLSIGAHTVSVNVSDGSLVVSWSWNLTIRGNTAPVINSKTPATATYSINELETLVLSVNATDPEGDAISYSWIKNGITQYGQTSAVYTFTTSPVSAGTYNFQVSVTDAYGLVTNVSWTITVLNANAPPVVQISSHSNMEEVIQGNSVPITGIASDADGDGTITAVEISIDGGMWTAATGTVSWNYYWDTSSVSLGNHVISVRAFDGANYSQVASITLVVISGGSNNPPTVTITSPTAGDTVSGTISVTGTATDDTAVVKVQVKIDSSAWFDATGTNSWSYSLNTLMMSDGTHMISARANDGILNSTVVWISVNVSNGGSLGNYTIATIGMLVSTPENYVDTLVMLQNAVTIENGSAMYVVDDSAIQSMRIYKYSGSVAPAAIRLGDVLTIKGKFIWYAAQMCYEIEVYNTTVAPGDGIFYMGSTDVNTKYRPVTLETVMNNMAIYNNTLVKVSPLTVLNLTGYPASSSVTITVGDGVNTFALYFDTGSARPSLDIGWSVEVKAIVTVYHSTTNELKIRKWWTPDTIYPIGNMPPTISITSPTNNQMVNGTLTVTGTASDSDGTITLVEVQIDNNAYAAATGLTSWSYSVDTTSWTEGTHTIRARATDNSSMTATATVNVLFTNSVYQTVTIAQLLASPTSYNDTLVRLAEVNVRDNGSIKPTSTTCVLTVNDSSTTTGYMVYVKNNANRPSMLSYGDRIEVRGRITFYATNQYWELEVEATTVRPGDIISLIGSGPMPEYIETSGDVVCGNAGLYNRTLVRLVGAVVADMGTYTTAFSSTTNDMTVTHGGQTIRLFFRGYVNKPAVSVGSVVDIQGMFYEFYKNATSSGVMNIEIRPYFSTDYFMINTGGNEAPTVTINTPASGATLTGEVVISGTAADTDGTVSLVEVQLGAGAWLTATGTTSWTITVNTTTYPNGATTITARATDNGSLQGTTTIPVTVSNTITYTTMTISQLYADTASNENHWYTINNAFVIDNGTTSSATANWNLVVTDASTARSLCVYVSKYAVRPSVIQLGDTLTISGKFAWFASSTKSVWEIEVNSTANCTGDGVSQVSTGGTLVYTPSTPAAILADIPTYNMTLVKFEGATIVDMGSYTTTASQWCAFNVTLGGQTMYVYFNSYSMRISGLSVGATVDICGYFYVYYSYSGGAPLPELVLRKWWTPDSIALSTGGNVAPTVAITSPSANATLSGEVTITGTSSDSDGTVTLVEVQLGAGSWLTATGTTSWTITVNTTTYPNGASTITARATDNGSAQSTASIPVTISNTAMYMAVTMSQLFASPTTYNGTFVSLSDLYVRDNGSMKQSSTTWTLVVNDSSTVTGLTVYVKNGASRPATILNYGDVINVRGRFVFYSGNQYWEIEVESSSVRPGDFVQYVSAGPSLSYTTTTADLLASNAYYYNRTLVMLTSATVLDLGTYTTAFSSSTNEFNISHNGQTLRVFVRGYVIKPTLLVGSLVDINGMFYEYYKNATSGGVMNVEIRPYFSPDLIVLATGGNEAPTIAITSPANGDTVSGNVVVTGTAGDSDGTVATVEVKFGDSAWLAVNGTTSWTITVNSTGFANGLTSITARATDNGSAQNSTTITVTVSNTAMTYTAVTIAQLLAAPATYQNTLVYLQNVCVISNGSIKNSTANWNIVVNDSTTQTGLNVYVKSGSNRPATIVYLGDMVDIKGMFLWYQSSTGSGYYWEVEVNSTVYYPGDMLQYNAPGTTQHYPFTLATLLSNPDYYNRTLVKVDYLIVTNNSGYKTTSSSSCSIMVGDGVNEIKVYFNSYSIRPATPANGTRWDFSGIFYIYFSNHVGTPEIEIRPYWSPDNMESNLTHHRAIASYEPVTYDVPKVISTTVVEQPVFAVVRKE